jgi:hypothetical protein
VTNEVDKRNRARTSSSSLTAAAKAEALELGPQIVGAFEGVALAIRELIAELQEQRTVTLGLTHELSALRAQRAKGGNGHAPDDNLEGDAP